ncbi:hypothetical protein A9Q97_00195 [Rhodospirillales bacterium 47_12_T64]|nr:hypothetical protein A9Q97_00195 [Rhodospirillales bacterium 47_12_T64]
MNKVRLPLATTPSPQSGVTQTAQASTLASYPPSLGARPVQEQISGTIQGQNKSGQLIVQTLLGDLAVNSNIKLPPGTEIIIQFRTHHPPFEVLLVPQHNKVKLATPAPPHNPQDKLTLGQTLQATFLNKSSDQPQSSIPGNITQIPPGKSFPVRIEIISPSAQQNPTTKASSGLPAGQQVTQSSQATPLSSPSQTNKTPRIDANTLNATVIGTSKGQPIVQTSLGNIQLSFKAVIPIGAQINLTFLPAVDETTGDNSLRRSSLPLTGGLNPGQDLRTSLQSALSTLIPQGQGNALASHIPHQGSALTSGILLFLNAIKAGPNRPWVGQDTLSLLRSAGNTELAQQLTNENATLSRPLETSQGDWRMTQLPILHEGILEKANLFVRDRESGSQKGKKPEREEATRFKLEVEMSRDGDMQFDGLVKKNRFDLVVRSRESLPNTMQSRISDLFYGANEATGFTGRLTFEPSQEWEKLTDVANKLIAGTHNSTLA